MQQDYTGSQQGQEYFLPNLMPADFNALTSSWSPADEVGNRPPQDLAYYALAAGQQRGGYLTHQSLQPYPGIPVYTHPSIVPVQLGATNGRPFAPLPRNSSLGNGFTPVLQQSSMPTRMSLSLSPVDIRNMEQYQQGYPHPHSAHFSNQMLVPGQFPMYNNTPLHTHAQSTPPPISQGCSYFEQRPVNAFQQHAMFHSQASHLNPLEPSLQNLALSNSSSSSMATPLAQRQQPTPPQFSTVPYQSYYSSFANNGLPGVLSWPAQALAKYHNVVQPHQQAWPTRDLS